jgi:hypothetical protein
MNTTEKSRKEYFAELKILHEFLGYKFGLEYPLYQFDTDWNWLMEVVEKIETLDDEDFNFNISITGVEISNVNNFETIVLYNSGANKITVVYDACIEFIKWYNQQEK